MISCNGLSFVGYGIFYSLCIMIFHLATLFQRQFKVKWHHLNSLSLLHFYYSGNVVWDLIYVARGSLNVRTDYSMSDSLQCCLELDQALVIQMNKKQKNQKQKRSRIYFVYLIWISENLTKLCLHLPCHACLIIISHVFRDD